VKNKFGRIVNKSVLCRMKDKVRIEIHLEPKEVKELDKLAKAEDRSRKNFCETVIKKIINKTKN
jgi:hypothetical protein